MILIGLIPDREARPLFLLRCVQKRSNCDSMSNPERPSIPFRGIMPDPWCKWTGIIPGRAGVQKSTRPHSEFGPRNSPLLRSYQRWCLEYLSTNRSSLFIRRSPLLGAVGTGLRRDFGPPTSDPRLRTSDFRPLSSTQPIALTIPDFAIIASARNRSIC